MVKGYHNNTKKKIHTHTHTHTHTHKTYGQQPELFKQSPETK